MDRRSFLKGCFGAIAAVTVGPFIPKLKKSEASIVEAWNKEAIVDHMSDHQKLLEMISRELRIYPKGHVARSITGIRIATNPEDFESLFEGLSVGSLKDTGRYFSMSIRDIQILYDYKKRKTLLKDVFEQLRIGWKHESVGTWGVA